MRSPYEHVTAGRDCGLDVKEARAVLCPPWRVMTVLPRESVFYE
jgi:hypothetical protein